MDRLTNTVRPYPWGSATALPQLMGLAPDGTPQAELWMGAHPAAPSYAERTGRLEALDKVVAADPRGELGDWVVDRFGSRLPFLLKLLAADAPLSLQVHPDADQAAAGFAREEERGVPLDAPHRSYRDPHHKPEMIVALGPFEGLCGFRAPGASADLLETLGVAGLAPYVEMLRSGRPEEQALREVFTGFLSAGPDLVDDVTDALARSAREGGERAALFDVYHRIARAHPGDAGVPAALLVRHVRLSPGEALFLGAGVPHAYVRGLGVEIMAASDNVLRCGLTDKHVDVAELLRVVRFEAVPVRPSGPVFGPGGEDLYPAPVDDFRLSRVRVRTGGEVAAQALGGRGPQILVCTEGAVRLRGPQDDVLLTAGRSVYARHGERIAVSGEGTVFRATVPVPPVN
ncbi:mannose-6-phosphate isomerase, class I [Streptomyces sp. NPDC053367]|uniref:mannose-6-phosphate isomerase, class I n=1 Tax=Streptomyces sp. NPDC053367 TaxID=3365700 RepID=UPI0037CF3FC7